jgi:ABC-type uncharacterized transport system substrate-binding protein
MSYTAAVAAIRYLQQATTTIPTVMVYSTDPVKNGFVASLSHPAGNITGLAGSSDDTTPKQLELLRTLAPNASRIGILGNPAVQHFLQSSRARASAEKDNFSVLPIEARSAEEIEDAFHRYIPLPSSLGGTMAYGTLGSAMTGWPKNPQSESPAAARAQPAAKPPLRPEA